MINLASHILTNILLANFHVEMKRSSELFAVSPIEDIKTIVPGWFHFLHIGTLSKENSVIIHIRPSPSSEDSFIGSRLANTVFLQNILQLILKKTISIKYDYSYIDSFDKDHYKVIAISLDANNHKSIYLYIPVGFLRIFSRSIEQKSTSDFIENQILHYFRNPFWLLPDARLVIGMLSDFELSALLHYLQNMNLITPYQLTLLLYAYPDMSFRLKNALSKNTIRDIIDCKKHLRRGDILKRDIAGGLYAMEESLYVLFMQQHHFWFSSLLNSIQRVISSFLFKELLENKDFSTWFSEIHHSGLLYNTLSLINERTIANAISFDINTLITIISTVISKHRVEEILECSNTAIQPDERFKSQIDFICAYRKIKMSRMSNSPESLGYLFSSMHSSDDFNRVLLTVGWFLLSTSLKGLKERTVKRVLNNIDLRPRLLIEDVLRGIVNPNILHDEIQIHKAQGVCVKAIVQLYNDCIINLE